MNLESKSECLQYRVGTANIKIAFPAGHETCQYCSMLGYESYYDRYYCRITDEWILNFKKERNEGCPIEWEE